MVLEQLQYGKDNVINVAEARSLHFLGVVQTTRPVDGDVRKAVVQLHGGVQRAPYSTAQHSTAKNRAGGETIEFYGWEGGISHRLARYGTGMVGCNMPDSPVYVWQNSKSPSNTGQSVYSPTLNFCITDVNCCVGSTSQFRHA